MEQIRENNYSSISGQSNDKYINYKDEIDSPYYLLKSKKVEEEIFARQKEDYERSDHFLKLILKNKKLFTAWIDRLSNAERIILRNFLIEEFPSMKLPKNLYFNYETNEIIKENTNEKAIIQKQTFFVS